MYELVNAWGYARKTPLRLSVGLSAVWVESAALALSAAFPTIWLSIGRCSTKDSAVLELEFARNRWMGVAVYEAGGEMGSPQHICYWADGTIPGCWQCCTTLAWAHLPAA
jgi:hypothetical protein